MKTQTSRCSRMKSIARWCVMALITIPALALRAEDPPASAPATARSSSPTSRPAADSPKAAVKIASDILPAGGLKTALIIYYCTNAPQRDLANAMARCDIAAAYLENYARVKFGCDGPDGVDHALRQPTDADLDRADEKIDGDHASIIWKDAHPPLKMIKVDGVWKVDVAAILDDWSKAREFTQTQVQIADALDQVVARAHAGQYANLYLLERAIKQKLYAILGEEEEQ